MESKNGGFPSERKIFILSINSMEALKVVVRILVFYLNVHKLQSISVVEFIFHQLAIVVYNIM